MYIRCYQSSADIAIQEQLWRAIRDSGWMSSTAVLGYNKFFIPEDRVSWCLLIDSTLYRVPREDYII
jgi:hypothetical protein